MKLTKQDYQNALKIYNVWFKEYRIEISFPKYIKEKREQPETPMYRCIQVPPNRGFYFKVGELYNSLPTWFNLSDLPNHFELVEPEPEPEKITWQEVITLIDKIKSKGFLPQDFYIEILKTIRQIQTDHL